MSEQPKDGGPAYPGKHPKKVWNGPLRMDVTEMREQGGMSLRDWFAGQSLKWAGHGEWFSSNPEHVAERAYKMADAMIKARVQP